LDKAFIVEFLLGTPDYFFYIINVPEFFSRPKVKPAYSTLMGEYQVDHQIFGIYNIAKNTNKLLDTDDYFQTGIINDLNGGLPFFPRYYAGNNEVVDIWSADEMKELLTDEYFAKQTVKDPQGHQKLKELLKNLKDDDNPVVVIAKLK
jgi:hypothetical protein